MEATLSQPKTNQKRSGTFFSKPLFKQTLKANWVLWLAMTLGSALLFIIINLVIGSRSIFTKLDMNTVTVYVNDEGLSWLQILGLLEQMGFSLSRIEAMSQLDLSSIMGELIYKIAGVLLPMIYVMITANSLIAAQVSSGSMAYVLSTPTSRKTVLRTNYLYLVGSLFVMYLIITLSALGAEQIAVAIRVAKGGSSLSFPLKTILLCVGSFFAIFALSGICFGASTWFNKAQQSVAVGGGVSIVCFLCCILGLFGSPVFVSVGVGVKAMSVFNYATLFTLIDTDSISSFVKVVYHQPDAVMSLNWIWEFAILIVIGLGGALVGSIKFLKKDLPL